MHSIFQLLEPIVGPSPPTRFSHSALTQIETCPRRWWLLHGQYRGLPGAYPQPISAPAARGRVVHRVLENFGTLLGRAGNPSPGSAAFFAVRQVFALRPEVQKARREELERLSDNPRVDAATIAASVSADSCIESFKRLQVRAYAFTNPALASDDHAHSRADAGLPPPEGDPTLRRSAELLPGTAIGPTSGSVRGGIATIQTSATGSWRRGWPPCPGYLPEIQVRVDKPPSSAQSTW